MTGDNAAVNYSRWQWRGIEMDRLNSWEMEVSQGAREHVQIKGMNEKLYSKVELGFLGGQKEGPFFGRL